MKLNNLQELHIVTRGRYVRGEGEYELVVVTRNKDDGPGRGKRIKKITGATGATTPNEAHYHAVIAAVEYLDGLTMIAADVPLIVHTPSQIVAGEKNAKALNLVSLAEKVDEMVGRVQIKHLSGVLTRSMLAM